MDPEKITSVHDHSVIDIKEKPKTKIASPKYYHVIFLNDDFTSMSFVVYVLQEIFHKSRMEAREIALTIHIGGKGVAGTYTYEIAEQKIFETMGLAKQMDFPLRLEMEEDSTGSG